MVSIQPLHEEFGATITDFDLTEPFTEERIQIILDAINQFSLICFPNQKMTDDVHIELTRRIGNPEVDHVRFGKTGEIDYFGVVGNVTPSGKLGSDASNTKFQRGNEMWHSDSSFREIPSFLSITHAYEVPGEGGQTLFASMRAAYQRLSEGEKQQIENLQVVHDYVYSRSKVAPVEPAHAASLPPIVNRMVRRNPVNHLKNFYIGSHARDIVGWDYNDSRKLLDNLLQRTTGQGHVYSHQWAIGDTVIWDNRCLLHRGGGYDADRWRRYMRQTRVAGSGPTLNE